MILIMDRNVVLFAVASIVGVGSSISTLEWISNKRQLDEGGLFDWQVVGSRKLAIGRRWHARLIDHTLRYKPFVTILWIRLLAVILLPLSIWWQRSHLFLLLTSAIVLLTTLLMNLRSIYGMDGSDQMTTHIYSAIFLGFLSGTSLGLEAAIWYIAIQSCFSYFTSGLAKAISPAWRRGEAVYRIFNTRTYGYEAVARTLRGHPRLSRIADWSAFSVETAFPLALVAGFPLVILFIAWGIAFHLMNALVMGLNSFLWAFTATYPAIIYVAFVIQH